MRRSNERSIRNSITGLSLRLQKTTTLYDPPRNDSRTVIMLCCGHFKVKRKQCTRGQRWDFKTNFIVISSFQQGHAEKDEMTNEFRRRNVRANAPSRPYEICVILRSYTSFFMVMLFGFNDIANLTCPYALVHQAHTSHLAGTHTHTCCTHITVHTRAAQLTSTRSKIIKYWRGVAATITIGRYRPIVHTSKTIRHYNRIAR